MNPPEIIVEDEVLDSYRDRGFSHHIAARRTGRLRKLLYSSLLIASLLLLLIAVISWFRII